MAVKDKFNRDVPGTPVWNRTDRKPFDKPVTIREEFPILGMVSVGPGEIKEIPAEVAERWTDSTRWGKMDGWPTEDTDEGEKVITPITKNIPRSVREAVSVDPPADPDADPDAEDDAPPVVVVPKTPTGPITRPSGK